MGDLEHKDVVFYMLWTLYTLKGIDAPVWRHSFFFLILKKFIYLFMRERKRQRHREREEQAPPREPNAGLDPGFQDHYLSLRQMLNGWATQAFQKTIIVCRVGGEMFYSLSVAIWFPLLTKYPMRTYSLVIHHLKLLNFFIALGYLNV